MLQPYEMNLIFGSSTDNSGQVQSGNLQRGDDIIIALLLFVFLFN